MPPLFEGMTRFSHSRLAAFENCPRQYEYRYVQRIPRDTESVEAFLGKRVHEILERLYHHVGRHGRPPSLRQVLDRFRRDWDLRWHAKVEVIKQDQTVEDYLERGRRCLENYYRGHYPFDRDETVAIEHKVELDLDPDGRYPMRGIVDRVVRCAPGHYEIHDYKTGGWLPPQQRIDGDRQLPLYQIGLEQSYRDVEQVDLVWHYLQFNRTLRSRRSPEQLDALRRETIELIDTIRTSAEFPARPGPLCRWCEFRDICPDARVSADRAALVEHPPPPEAPAPPAEREQPLAAAPTIPRQLELFS